MPFNPIDILFNQLIIQSNVIDESEIELNAKALCAFLEPDSLRMTQLRDIVLKEGFSPQKWVYWALLKNNSKYLDNWPDIKINWQENISISSQNNTTLIKEILEDDDSIFLQKALSLGLLPDSPISEDISEKDINIHNLLLFCLEKSKTSCLSYLINQTNVLKNLEQVAEACLCIEDMYQNGNLENKSEDDKKNLKAILKSLDERVVLLSQVDHIDFRMGQEKPEASPINFLKKWLGLVFNNPHREDTLLQAKWKPFPIELFKESFNHCLLSEYVLTQYQASDSYSFGVFVKLLKWDEELIKNDIPPKHNLPLLFLNKALSQPDCFENLSEEMSYLLVHSRINEKKIHWEDWFKLLKKNALISNVSSVNLKLWDVLLDEKWESHLDDSARFLWVKSRPSIEKNFSEVLKHTRKYSAATPELISATEAFLLNINTLPERPLTVKNTVRI